MKKIVIVSSLLLLASCATQQGVLSSSNSGSIKPGQSLTTRISSANSNTINFNSGKTPPRYLEISSYLPAGGLGAAFSNFPVAYPSIVIKDESGKVVGTQLLSQKAVPPGAFSALHLESKWRLHLQPEKNYVLNVRASTSGHPAHTEFVHTSVVNSIGVDTKINTELKMAPEGRVQIKLD